jgi:WD40 repeat protein
MPRRVAVVCLPLLCLLLAAVAAGQGPQTPEALEAARQQAVKQEHTWLTRESTATLVPAPGRLPGINRWTIDTRRHRGGIAVAAISPDGGRVATGGFDGIVRIWNVDSGLLDRAIMAHRWNVKLLAWSPDGRWLASQAIYDGVVRIFDAATGRLAKELPGHFGVLAWAADSRRLAGSGGGSGSVMISENLADFKLLKEMGTGVLAMDWSPDGRLAVAAAANAVVVLDGSSGRQLFDLEDTHQQVTTQVVWSPNGKWICSGSYAGGLLSDGGSGKPLRSLGKAAYRCCWSADGSRIAVFDGGGVVVQAADNSAASMRQPIAANYLLAWRSTPEQLVAVGAERVEAWQPDGTKPESLIEVAAGRVAPVFVPGRPIIAGLQTPTPSLWDAAKFTLSGRLEGHSAPVTVARWAPSGSLLATADSAGTVRTWKSAGEAVDTFAASGPVTLLEWSGDGKAIAVAGPGGPVEVFSPTGERLATLPGHDGGVLCLAWGTTKEQLATGGNDGRAVIWDLAEGSPRRSIEAFGKVTGLAWQRGGQLAVGSREGGLAVVNPGTGAVVKEIMPTRRGSPNPVRGLVWLTGGPPRLIMGQGGLVRAADVASGILFQRQLALVVEPSLPLPRNMVATPSADRVVRFWSLTDGALLGFLVDDGTALAAVSASGDVGSDPGVKPDLIAVVEREEGQQWMTLDEFAKACGWKNNPKAIRLPTRQ